jgi:hypothetical protein
VSGTGVAPTVADPAELPLMVTADWPDAEGIEMEVLGDIQFAAQLVVKS